MLGTIATQLTTPETRTVSVFVGGRDVTGRVDARPTTIEDGSSKTVTQLRLEGGLAELPELAEMARMHLVDHASGEAEAFTGYVRSLHPITGLEPVVDLVADGIGSLLDDTFVPAESRPVESDAARIGYFWGAYAGSHLSGDLSRVVQLRADMPAAEYVGLSLRAVLQLIAAQASASADFYVDPAGRLHYFANEGISAPYAVKAGTPANYSPHVLALAPVAYWRLGEAAGTQATDASGNGRHATYSGSPLLAQPGLLTGDSDTAVRFDGLTQFAITDAALPARTRETWAAWITPHAIPALTPSMFMGLEVSTGQYFGMTTSRQFFVSAHVAGIQRTFAETTARALDQRYFVCRVVDGTNLILYVDGVEVARRTDAIGDLTAPANRMNLGRWNNASHRSFEHTLDDPKVYDRALTDAEIAELYEIGTAQGHYGTVAVAAALLNSAETSVAPQGSVIVSATLAD